jgi:hypothetical protein
VSRGKAGAGSEAADLIARFRDDFAAGELTIAEGVSIIERLQILSDEALPRIRGLLTSPEEEARQVAIVLLRELGDPRAVAPLRRMLRNSDYSDEEKLSVLQALEALGAPVDEATFRKSISDPEALIRRSLAYVLEAAEDPAHVEFLLEGMEGGPPGVQEQYVREVLAPLADPRLLLLFVTLLHNEHDGVIVAAIDAIERLKEPAVIPLLEERAQCDPSGRVRHAAENAALRLRTRIGSWGEGDLSFPWIRPSPLPLTHCMLSTIDGSGGQVLFVAREEPDGDLQVVDLMFNDHEGIKDCFSGLVDESELAEFVVAFESIEFVDISLARARAEVARAYQTTLDARRRLPPTFMIWQGWIEGEDADPPEESPVPRLEPSDQAELLAECDGLFDLNEFDYWFFNPDEVEPFLSRYQELLRRNQVEQGLGPFDALLDEAIQVVMCEKHWYPELLPDRLRRQAWLLAQLYEDQEVTLWALAAAVALEEGVIVAHPLLREMMHLSFVNASEA